MGKEMKNVIIFKNIYSNLFDEVIFVLKKDNKKIQAKDENLVHEAKRIVEEYINKTNIDGENCKVVDISRDVLSFEKGNRINVILNLSLVLSVMLFVIMLYKVF